MTEVSSTSSSLDRARTHCIEDERRSADCVCVTKIMYFMGTEFDRGRTFPSSIWVILLSPTNTRSRLLRLSLVPHHFSLPKWKMILRSNLCLVKFQFIGVKFFSVMWDASHRFFFPYSKLFLSLAVILGDWLLPPTCFHFEEYFEGKS